MNRNPKRILALIYISFLLFNITGCDYKDIDNRLFIVAMGIDKGDTPKEFKITFKAALPIQQEQNNMQLQPDSQIFTVKDTRIGRVFRRLKAYTAQEPDFSHMKIIIFGKKFAKINGIKRCLDYFMRRRDIQNMAWVLQSEESAKDILKMTPKNETVPGSDIFLTFEGGVQSEYVEGTNLYEIYRTSRIPGSSMYCPLIHKSKDIYIIDKIAIFNNGKYRTTLSEEETKYFNILTAGVNIGYLDAPDNKYHGYAGISINSAKGKFTLFDSKKDNITYGVKVKVSGEIEDVDDIHNPSRNRVAREIEKTVTDSVTKLLNKMKRLKIDPLFIGEDYWSKNASFEMSDRWKTKIFPKVKFKVSTNVDITGSGSIMSKD